MGGCCPCGQGVAKVGKTKLARAQVTISNKYDRVDAAGLRLSCDHASDSLHGEFRKHKATSFDATPRTKTLRLSGQSIKESLTVAEKIVVNAKNLAAACARAIPQQDHEWELPYQEDKLCALFGEEALDIVLKKYKELANALTECVKKEQTINDCCTPVKIFGDIHGQCRDLLLLLHHYGFPSESKSHCYIFNGDWVDRGKHQLETLALVYAMKLAYPDKVFLNRGNHEDADLNASYEEVGFAAACEQRFDEVEGQKIFGVLTDTFRYLPMGTLVEEQILVIHAGIGSGMWDLGQIRKSKRPIDIASCHPDLYNILWSDPIDEDQRKSFGVHSSSRDGHTMMVKNFGQDITETFLKRNGLDMIIRSHEAEVAGSGYEVMHGGKLLRVFSAPDYEGMQNDGAILAIERVDGDDGAPTLRVRPQQLGSLAKASVILDEGS